MRVVFIYLNSLKLGRIVAIGASIRTHMADRSIDPRSQAISVPSRARPLIVDLCFLPLVAAAI